MLSNQFRWSLVLLMLIFICSACQTNNSQEEYSSSIPLHELILLSEKGERLSWNDFERYEYEDEGSGLYIRKYNVEGGNHLIVSGKRLDKKTDHIYVVRMDGQQIDFVKENIEDLEN
ncbi:hypothetical protein [Paenibacillus illinoisensis]|uniref:hypothetical protein n=1 Tax=Paenibacillus illinoisensis TaxID=59845 RepID=UPI00301CB1DE